MEAFQFSSHVLILLLAVLHSASYANGYKSERTLKLLEDSRYHYIPIQHDEVAATPIGRVEFLFRSDRDETTLLHLQGDHEFATFTLTSGLLHLFLRDATGKAIECLSSPDRPLSDWKWHNVVLTEESGLLRLLIDDRRFIVGRHQLGSYTGTFLAADRGHVCVANAVLNEDDLLTSALQTDLCADDEADDNVDDDTKEAEDGVEDENVMRDKSVSMSIQPVFINEPIAVREGGSAALTNQNMYIFPQYHRYGLKSENALFRIVDLPKHGKLTKANRLVAEQFTYADVLAAAINYTHDGTETSQDGVELEVEFRNLDDAAPAALKHSYSYTLAVHVSPVNDPPEIKLPNGPVIELAQSSRIKFNRRQMMIADPDNPPKDVMIKVTYATPGGATFERVNHPGTPLTEFSQEELIADRIRLRHGGDLESKIHVIATDSESQSAPQPLTIRANPVQFRLVRKTDLKVLHKSSELITNANLSFVTNADQNGNHDITYTIIKIPECGFIEVEDEAGRWWIAQDFNQSDVDNRRVRYRHSKTEQTSISDSFRFQVSAGSAETRSSVVYELKIVFIPVNIKVFNPTAFVLNNTQIAYLTHDHLFAWTFPKASPAERLVYHVTQAPKAGFLYRVINRQSGRRRRLGLYSNFTQADVDAGNIYYDLHHVHYTRLHDHFRFKVVAPFVSSDQLQFDINFMPGQTGIKLINRTLIVSEGQLHKVVNTTLSLETPDDKDFVFTITTAPTHGEFHKYTTTSMGTNLLEKGDNFTSEELNNGKVYYRHDGSETTSDKAYIVARPMYRSTSSDAIIPFWFTVTIILENDHSPQRTREDTFHIVFRGERIVTKTDLEFTDKDSDFESSKLTYHFMQEYREGGIYWVASPDMPVYNFTQDDINQRRLLFRHTGKRRQLHLPLMVSDGQRLTKSYLDVNASAPFLRVKHNTGVVVDQGGLINISPANLTVDTNLNIGPSGITYERVGDGRPDGSAAAAAAGRIIVLMDDRGRTTRRIFTQSQINSNRVVYSEDRQGGARRETLTFQVQAANLRIHLNFDIVVRGKPEEKLLQLLPLQPMTVPSGGLGSIGPQVLKATHPAHDSRSIYYKVLGQPRNGRLILETSSAEITAPTHRGTTDDGVTQFTQYAVDRGYVQYMHEPSKSPGGTESASDSIALNVTAGNETIGPIALAVIIKKNQVKLVADNLTVNAATRTPLPNNLLRAESSYLEHSKFVFHIVQLPRHGFIETLDGSAVIRFTDDQLNRGLLYYTHDMSSSWNDELMVEAIMQQADDQVEVKSQPQTVHITIKHDNVRGPELVRNVPLQMWSNKVAPITQSLLAHHDFDTQPSNIVYYASSEKGGYVALVRSPTKPIYNFTQTDIDNNRIAFVRYRNGTSGGFSFIVSDGKFNTNKIWFSVEAVDLNVALEVNSKLVIAPGAETTIGTDLLRAKIPAVQLWQIQFTVTKPPTYGKLFVRDRPAEHFTQLDINQRSVVYRQDGQIARTWHVKDSFLFRITVNGSAGGVGTYASSDIELERRFRVLITYSALTDRLLDAYIDRRPMIVTVGASLVVNSSFVNTSRLSRAADESLLMSVTREPRLGTLEYAGNNLTDFAALKITQTDVNGHMLIYAQTARLARSLPVQDQITVQIFPASQLVSRKRHRRLEFRLTIQIVPPPDDHVFLIRHCPEELRLVRGSSVTFRPQLLLSEAADVLPSDLFYDVVQGPLGGYFRYNAAAREHLSSSQTGGAGGAARRLLSFSQAAVNKEAVDFVQDGNAKLGVFTLAVRTPTAYYQHTTRVVRVRVEPLTLSLVNHTDIRLRQGQTNAVVSARHLGADSNGPRRNIIYRVAAKPENGSLIWKDTKRQADTFSQVDVDRGNIFYAQENLETWRDAFRFDVFNAHNNVGGKVLNVFVRPNVVQVPFVKVEPGGSFKLTEQFLDASALHDKAPRFLIVQPPKYGRIVMHRGKIRKARNTILETVVDSHNEESRLPNVQSDSLPASHERLLSGLPAITGGNVGEVTVTVSDVTFFTFEDIKMGIIRYMNTLSAVETAVMEDSFEYELHATGVQPARAVFFIHIQSSNLAGRENDFENGDRQTRVFPTTPSTLGKGLWLPKITQGYTWPIAVVIGIALLALLIIVIRRIRIKRKRDNRFIKEKQQELRQLQSSLEVPIVAQPDLLGSTVYADIGHQRTATIHRKAGGGGGGGGTSSSSAYNSDSGVGPTAFSHSITLDGRTSCRNSQLLASSMYGSVSKPAQPTDSRMITFDAAGRTELISSVPMCKVTPLTPRPNSGGAMPSSFRQQTTDASGSSSDNDWRYAYQYSSSAASDNELKAERLSLDRATGVRPKRAKTSSQPPSLQHGYPGGVPAVRSPTKLKENQYWV